MSREDLYERWLALRASEKRLFAVDAATRLNVTECELVASACGAAGSPAAVRLGVSDWSELLLTLPKLGKVKTITRNPSAVIEIEGSYDRVEFFGLMGQSVGSIDLRIFLRVWRHAFYIKEETARGISESLQFFDATGRAIHKLYVRPETNREVFSELIEKYRAADQTTTQVVEHPTPPRAPLPDRDIDAEELRKAWLAMSDTHEFFGLLQRFNVTRTQALRLGGSDLAYPVALDSLERVLESSASSALPIMVFVGNPGIIQIYSGPVGKLVPMDSWINILDPAFNLHVRRDLIDSAWIVRKPTKDGNVTSLELYTAEGDQIALLVGQRKPGQKENESWRNTLETLPRAGSA
ncbi:hemin-degrading factor [Pendulispora albinea]|uniref:Hemin-degrading factor n=1 Tax=Pendulispora albinea TaxID=2741071 RepID=A0ABZ2M1H1_9BACT